MLPPADAHSDVQGKASAKKSYLVRESRQSARNRLAHSTLFHADGNCIKGHALRANESAKRDAIARRAKQQSYRRSSKPVRSRLFGFDHLR